MSSTSVLGAREAPDEQEGGGGGPGVVAVASKSVIAGRKILKARSRRKKPAATAPAAAPAAGDGGALPRTPADWEAAVRGIYAAHNPAKLDNVPDLLAKYKGHEATLVDKLRAKYNVAAPAPAPAPAAGAFAGFDLCAAASGNSPHTSPAKSAAAAPMLEFKLVTSPPALASVAPHAPAAAAAAAASSSLSSSSLPAAAAAAAASSAIPLAQRGPRMAVLAGAGAGAGAAQLARWDTAFRVHWESSQHRSVVVLVFDAGEGEEGEEGEGAEQLLLHKRSGDLDCYGGYWDGSAGGDVLLEDYAFDAAAGGAGPAEEAARADGAYRRAARRKLRHELGLGGEAAAAAAAAGEEEEGGAGGLHLEEWQTLAPAGTRNAHTRVFIARVPNLGAVAAAAPARADGGIAELRRFSSDSFRALLEVGTLVRPQLLEVLGRLNTAAPASVAFRKQEPFSAPSGGGGGHKMIRLENDLIDDTKTEDKTSLRYLSEQRARLGFSPTALGAGASASDAK